MTSSFLSRHLASRPVSVLRFSALAFLVACVGIAGAQNAGRFITADTFDASRAELTQRLDSLTRVNPSSGKSAQRKERDREIRALRERLADGDFPPGDRFLIDYGTPGRPADTVLVRDSSNISLVNWPSTSLRGVLHVELQGAVEKYVGTYVREPRLRVFPLTRVSIIGGVARPGFYAVDPKRSLTDALMAAGGTGQVGKLDKIAVYRGEDKLVDEKRVAQAIESGLTVEDLHIRSGDQIRVAAVKQPRNLYFTLQPILIGISVLTAILAVIRASYAP